MKIYVAGPLGFSEAGRYFYYRKILRVLRDCGHKVLDPWRLTEKNKTDAAQRRPYGKSRRDAWRKLNIEIGDNNRSAIDRCDLIVAILDGPDVDSGTAAEIGYAFAKGRLIVGYRNDFRLAADNEGAIINLQVEYFIRKSGGFIFRELRELRAALTKLERYRRARRNRGQYERAKRQ